MADARIPAIEPGPFSFVQVTDLHLSLGEAAYGPGAGDATFWFDGEGLRERIVTTPAVLDALFEELASLTPRPAFMIATGDLTNTGSDEEYEAYAAAVARARIPIVSMPGNHDHHTDASEGARLGARYERHLGARWFSFDAGGVHVACIDWFTHLLGIDADEQEAWLAADLDAVEPGTPVIVMSHDLMRADFYERLPRAPIATFSGHWHTTRVVRSGDTVHYNTGTATFGGLDYSPAHYRVASWDGARLAVRTVARGPARIADATFRPTGSTGARDGVAWARALSGAVHLAEPVIAGDAVVATSKLEDTPGGFVEAFGLADGEPRWRVALGSAVKAAALVAGDAVVAVAVTGETVCVDLATGAERWRRTLADDTLLWTYLRPATDGARVFVGDVARFAALDLATGATVWARDDLGQRENMTSHAHPAVVDGRLLLSFVAQVPDLWALDPATGETLWPAGETPRSIYRCPPEELPQRLPLTPMAGLTPDPDGADVYVVRLGARLDRVRAADGAIVWSAPLVGWFNPGPPAIAGDAVIASVGTGIVLCLDRATGAERWRVDLGHEAPVAMGPYRAEGGALLGGVAVAGDRFVATLGDGTVAALDREGARVASFDAGAPLAARAAVGGGRVVVAGTDGVLRALDPASLGLEAAPDLVGGSSLYI